MVLEKEPASNMDPALARSYVAREALESAEMAPMTPGSTCCNFQCFFVQFDWLTRRRRGIR